MPIAASRYGRDVDPLVIIHTRINKNRPVRAYFFFELGTVLSSNQPLPLWLFLNLYRLITPELILKLNALKSHLDIPSFKTYEKWYHKRTE